MNSKAQGLALNTIVIAILVIIVLLVIIVFFTTQVGETGDQLDNNSASQCNENNPALSTLGYDEYQEIDAEEGQTCSGLGDGWQKATGVANCCVR